MKTVNGYHTEPCFKDLVKKIALDIEKERSLSEPGILSLLEEGASKHQSIQDVVGILWEPALKTLEYEVDLLRWSLLRVDPNSNFAFFAIASNGLCVASEICWLLRGGYDDGALARQRTLFELVSVIGFMVYVAREIDKDIGTRWLDSQYIVQFKISDRRIKDLDKKKAKTGLTPEEERFYSSHMPAYLAIKAKYDDVIKKHSTDLAKSYGWARPAIKKINEKRKSEVLKELNYVHKSIKEVTLPFLESLHIIGNFAIHGGEEPIRSLYPTGGDDSKNSLTLGPTIYGIDHVITDTSRLVRILAVFVTFAFNNKDYAIASAMIYALDIQLPNDIKNGIKIRNAFDRRLIHRSA
jgi:hypothetical protein